jgi:tetratricopeptide (TPR) repeat protein
MNAPTDWVSAIAILGAGLILGLIFLFVFKGRKAAAKIGGEEDLERKDLEAKRDALIQQLRDPDLTPDERTRLELETASALRALDTYNGQKGRPAASVAAASPAADESAPSESAMNPSIKGFLWGAGSFAILAALGFFVWQSANPRDEGAPVTGGMGSGAQQQQGMPQRDPMILQLEAAVQREPENLDLRNNLAQAYLESENMMGVFEQTKVVLEKRPNDSRALTFQGLVRMAMGEIPAATEMIQRATKSDPKNLDAWVALAWLYVQQDKIQEGEAMIAEAAKQSPNDKARLEQVFAQMKQHAQDAKNQPQQTAAGTSGELPPGHPPVDGAPAAAAPAPAQAAAGGDRSVRITLSLDPAAKSRQGVLYVMARNPQGGPPVAVKRMIVNPNQFPLTFDFGGADSMMGQPLPDLFRLEARLDSDGDAATKPATDPAAVQDRVAVGASVQMALK